jgi:hypothetical protein
MRILINRFLLRSPAPGSLSVIRKEAWLFELAEPVPRFTYGGSSKDLKDPKHLAFLHVQENLAHKKHPLRGILQQHYV